jgi:uncharacterized protein
MTIVSVLGYWIIGIREESMAGSMKTPGVFIAGNGAFPSSVVEVATAVPAFIGYTQKAEQGGSSLVDKPWRITSIAEFHQSFGYGPIADTVRFSLETVDPAALSSSAPEPLAARDAEPLVIGGNHYRLTQVSGFYLLYYSVVHYFLNGGGPCYIVSIGAYDQSVGKHIDANRLCKGIDLLVSEREPTIVVVPDAVLLSEDQCASVQQAALKHCGGVMKNRVALLDVWEGYLPRTAAPDCVANFRDALVNDFLDFGIAYYPWVNTNLIEDHRFTYANIDAVSHNTLIRCIHDEFASLGFDAAKSVELSALVYRVKALDVTSADPNVQSEIALLTKTLTTVSPAFCSIVREMQRRLNMLPPCAAMAGIYNLVDSSRGVWKAPANVSLKGVISPTATISTEQQEDLNVTPQGKSINAIREFVGEGTLVWGARTLDGNSLDWRYVNVRRTLIMLEESIKLAADAMAFEPNEVGTWAMMKSAIGNFLTGIWKRGGLAGATADDAFYVHVGLGETMTPEDIAEGLMRVTVLVAVTRPAEFIEITFQQQMRQS